MPSVSYLYDGTVGGGGGTLTATITGATPGWYYQLDLDGSSGAGDTAVGTTLVLTATGVARFNQAGDLFLGIVWTDEGGAGNGLLPISATHFQAGQLSAGLANPGDFAAVFDHTTGDFTITFTPRGRATDAFAWYDGGDDFDGSGTVSVLVPNLGFSGIDGEVVVVEIHDAALRWWDDTACWWVYPDSDTVYSETPPPPPVPATHIAS